MSGLPKRPSPHEDPPAPTNPSNKRPHEETTSNKSVQPVGHLLDQSQDSSARFSKAPRIENREERRPVQTSPVVQPALVSAPVPAHHVLTQKTVLPLPSPSAVVSVEQKSNKESADVVVEKVSVPVPVQQSGIGTTNKAGNSTGISNKSGTNQDETKTPPTNGSNTNTSAPNPNPNSNIRLSNPNPNPNPSIPTWGFPPVPVPPSNNQPSLPSSIPPVPPTSETTTTTGTSTGTAPPDPLKKDNKLPKESPKPPIELPPPATTTPMHIDSSKDNINNNTENMTSATAHVTSATAHVTSATPHLTSATAHMTSATTHTAATTAHVTSAAGQVTSPGGQGQVAEQVQTQRRRQQRVARGGVGLTGNREPRFRSRLREDGLQGKGEASVIIYKAGECMQELLKSWREFKELQKDPKNGENSQIGPLLEIRIPSEYVISTNRQVKGAQLWGTDIYTNDSDLVAVLMHMGYCSPSSSPPPSAIQELKATIRVLPPQKFYTSTLRNNVRSRAWGEGISCSYRVENCFIVKKGGDLIELEPRLQHTSGLEPTLAPVSVERTMTTRSAASNALRQQKFVREVTVQYNLCNEPWLKYSINAVADKGLKKSQYTSARLKRGEVLYLETHFNRYELSFAGEKSTTSHPPNPNSSSSSDHHPNPNPNSHHQQNGSSSEDLSDSFRWTRCRKPMPEPVMRTLGIPLPAEHLEILADNLEWEEIQWSSNGVWVGDKEYSLARVQFISPK